MMKNLQFWINILVYLNMTPSLVVPTYAFYLLISVLINGKLNQKFFLFCALNCRTFELRHLGQIKRVFPEAYIMRQEKGLPQAGPGKHGPYQLTVEVNLGQDADPGENL